MCNSNLTTISLPFTAPKPRQVPTNCSQLMHAQWKRTWDSMTEPNRNNAAGKRRQRRRLSMTADGRGDRRALPATAAYADALIAHAVRRQGQHGGGRRRRLLLVDNNNSSTAASKPLLQDMHPLSAANGAAVSLSPIAGRIKINMLWKVSENGMLRLPTDRLPGGANYSLIVAVGSKLGSGLVCMLPENNKLIFLGLESHPINFALSHRNMLHPSFPYSNRVAFLPMGAANRTAMYILKQFWTVGCEDSAAAPRRRNASAAAGPPPTDCLTMPPIRVALPFIRLDRLLTEQIPSFYSFHYLAVSDSGVSALPRPLEILRGAGSLLGRFEMVSVDCPMKSRPSSSSGWKSGSGDDCGMGGSSSSSSSSSTAKRKHDRASFVHHLVTAGFVHWRCSGHACHFARLRADDLALAAYYHRIRSLHVNQPIAMSPDEGVPERRDKCLDDIYHEDITWNLRPGLRKEWWW